MADIELVIKIPEEIRLVLINNIPLSITQQSICVSCIEQAIINGTPLPKGHGRIGDLDALREEVSSWGMNDYEPSDFTDAIDDAPTVEAIPKADYENRLKADMVAMLTELQLEIEEKFNDRPFSYNHHQRTEFYRDIDEVIQQKINSLKENSDVC